MARAGYAAAHPSSSTGGVMAKWPPLPRLLFAVGWAIVYGLV